MELEAWLALGHILARVPSGDTARELKTAAFSWALEPDPVQKSLCMLTN